MWHDEHAVGIPVYLPPTWQFWHATVVCAPVSGNTVLLWSKLAGCHAVVLWQIVHCCEKPPATWFGFVVLLKSFRWHDTQAVLAELSAPPVWQVEQDSVACAPVRLKPVLAWSNFAPSHCAAVWHAEHSVGN